MSPHKLAFFIGVAMLVPQACWANVLAGSGTETGSAAGTLHLRVFTHRDTPFAQFPDNAAAKGTVPELMQCASDRMGFTYEFVIAPLSRSPNIMGEQEHALWFPSRHQGDNERLERLIGPIGTLKSYWYQLRSSVLDPQSEEFKAQTQVTAYSKSIFESELRQNGYNWVPGSADYNRLIYMLMSGQVDALSAADFRRSLDQDTRDLFEKRTKRTLVESVPISIQVSRFLKSNAPVFVTRLSDTIHACMERQPSVGGRTGPNHTAIDQDP